MKSGLMHLPRGRRRDARARGFTLVEVLVAVGITAVLAGFIVAIVSNVSGFWGRTSGKLSAEAQGRFILDQVTLDLQAALYRDDGNTWLAATILGNTNNTGLWNTTGSTAAALKPANGARSLQFTATGNLSDNTITGPRFGVAGTWLRFFTIKRGTNLTLTTTSAPVAVAYQIVRRAVSGVETRQPVDRRYLLHRSEVRPTNASTARVGTLETGFNITATAYAPTTNTAQTGDPSEIRYPTINTVIGENVIDFGVRCYVRDGTTATGLRMVFPVTNATLTYSAKSPSSLANATDPFPEVMDVMVRVLTDEGARLIAGYEASPQRVTLPQGVTAQDYWWQLALANSQLFTRRIVLNAKPL